MNQLEQFNNIINFLKEHNMHDKVIIAGSWAYYIYKNYYFKNQYAATLLRTSDLDIYIPFKWKRKIRPQFSFKDEIQKIGYVEKITEAPQGIYHKYYNEDFKLEFITEQSHNVSIGRGVYVYGLQIALNPIDNLEMINHPITVEINQDLILFVPDPVYFALHKVYIAERRKNELKKEKDWEQAIDVLSILEPSKIKKAFNSLSKKLKNSILENLKIKQADEYLELLIK